MKPTDHDCPGGCGRPVPRGLLACPACWSLLPAEMRRRVLHARGRDLTLISEALTWYRANVRNGCTA